MKPSPAAPLLRRPTVKRLDNSVRKGTLICLRDKPDATGVHRPWPTRAANGAMSPFIRRVAEIRDAAGLQKKITFRSVRHGGFTAGGDLSDADLNAVGAKTDATLDIYRKWHDGAAPPRAHASPRRAIKTRTFVHLDDQELVRLSAVIC